MAQVPLRMAQPGLVPPHQQRPPMMVSMTQPPPVSMQGLVSMAPMMGPGGGMAVMTQAMSHPDSGHDHHHTISGPYHHHHHPHPHHQHPPPHPGPRPHPPPQSHHPGPPQSHHPGPPQSHHPGPPHHPTGPPPSHTGPPHTQYHPHPAAGPHHGGPPSVPHSLSHTGHHNHSVPHIPSHNSGVGTATPHGHAQAHLQVQAPSVPINQPPQHSLPHSNHQMTAMSNRNTSPGHHQQQHHIPAPAQQPLSPHQVVPVQHSIIQSPQQQPQPTQIPHSVEKSSGGGGGIIILSNTNGPLPNNSINLTANSSGIITPANGSSHVMVNGVTPTPGTILSATPDCENGDPLSTREKTPMCLINELARYNKIQHQYCLTDEKGPAHKKTFTVTLRLGENDEEYTASGPSIKKAQHSAAALALESTKFKHPPPKPPRTPLPTKLTPTVELNALAMKRGEAAVYTFIETPRPSNPYSFNMPPNIRAMYNQKYYCRPPVFPLFYVGLKVGTREFMGEGATAQQAKHNAASKALKIIKALPIPETNGPIQGADLSELDPNAELKSPISLVHEIALKRNLTVMFEVVRESGPPHMRTFVTTCIVGDSRTQGEGTGKKASKKRAAELMLEELRKLPPLPPASLGHLKRKPTTKKKSRNLIKVGHEEQKAAPDYGQGINPISRLIQIQQAKKEKEPVYTLLAERGVPRRREFVMQVSVGGQSAQGSGPNKKLAKRAAAESMLQVLGYSRPQPQPSKSSIKMEGTHTEVDKTRKQVTFMEENAESSHAVVNGSSHLSSSSMSIPVGSGRQLVPGLIMMPDGSALHGYQQMQQSGMNGTNINPMVNIQATAAIAKELLESGSSATAKALSSKKQTIPTIQQQTPVQTPHLGVPQLVHQQQPAPQTVCHPPIQQQLSNHISHPPPPMQSNQQPISHHQSQSPPQPIQLQPSNTTPLNSINNNRNSLTISGNTSGQAVRPKDQLMYLANILNLQVQFTDFPKGNKSEYLSLVSLSTTPPHVSHGAGATTDASHDQACLNALRALAEMGLDSVTSANTDNNNS